MINKYHLSRFAVVISLFFDIIEEVVVKKIYVFINHFQSMDQ
jgi:hypothetical protein